MSEPDIDYSEPISVVEYDPAWPDRFEREAARLSDALAELDVRRIEHVGSTSVPGLAAKDIVDVLVVVPDEDVGWDCVDRLESVGYEFFREWDEPDGRLELGRWPEDGQRFNLNVRFEDGDGWRRNLLLREYMRDHPEAREDYEAVKRDAAARHADEPVEYTKAKSDVVQEILDDARAAGYDERI
ncbi:GrpB family protein [Halomicrobium zhouii]|nr:GrpB family protein [Halomicrobium zhouii]